MQRTVAGLIETRLSGGLLSSRPSPPSARILVILSEENGLMEVQ
jgi:hypothetical protein